MGADDHAMLKASFKDYTPLPEINIDEEQRLFYAALTRARKRLAISYSIYKGVRVVRMLEESGII